MENNKKDTLCRCSLCGAILKSYLSEYQKLEYEKKEFFLTVEPCKFCMEWIQEQENIKEI